jgi:hypothetical protein
MLKREEIHMLAYARDYITYRLDFSDCWSTPDLTL